MTVSESKPRARVIAHYLPQFHPTLENDEFWGAGFSEWVSVAGARPLFRGHVQPELPGELGFYDLRLGETRVAQAELARQFGIEGFLYWHYWFNGRRTLERPFNEVLNSGEPDFPFCLAWANHSWTRVWSGRAEELLIEQTYPGPDDTRRHFAALESAFHDHRYVRVDGRPVFFLFRPQEIPDLGATLDLWRSLAEQSGLGGLHIVGRVDGFWNACEARRVAAELDAVTDYSLGYLAPLESRAPRLYKKVRSRLSRKTTVLLYEEAALRLPRLFDSAATSYPTAIPGWDSTPRHGARGVVLRGRTPSAFERMLETAVSLVESRPFDDRIVFLKSWNEWAEGNFLEPDRAWGRAFLEACGRVLSDQV